jgi:hypothetical protein
VGAEKQSRFTGRIPKLVLEIRDGGAHAEAEARIRQSLIVKMD